MVKLLRVYGECLGTTLLDLFSAVAVIGSRSESVRKTGETFTEVGSSDLFNVKCYCLLD
jgi:hypothetical protein